MPSFGFGRKAVPCTPWYNGNEGHSWQTITAPPTTAEPGNVAYIRQRISDGRRLVATGQLGAAAVLVWSAFEAAVRLSLEELGQQTDDPIWISGVPAGLCAQAVAYGVIDPEDRDVLLRFLSMNAVASQGSAEPIGASMLQEVSRFTVRTLDEMGR